MMAMVVNVALLVGLVGGTLLIAWGGGILGERLAERCVPSDFSAPEAWGRTVQLLALAAWAGVVLTLIAAHLEAR